MKYILDGYTYLTDDKPVVSWKDEGRASGPAIFWTHGQIVCVLDPEEKRVCGAPFRPYKAPEYESRDSVAGEIELGWVSRAKAKTLAATRGVAFVEV